MARVEAHVTDHLRDYVQDLEKCKVLQIFHVHEARIWAIFFGNFLC